MSSSTSRLQLTKLADSENFINTVLNANWDKVDNGYGTLNSQITNKLGNAIIGTISQESTATQKFNAPNGTRTLFILKSSYNETFDAIVFLYVTNSGGLITTPIYVGSNVTIDSSGTNLLKFTLSTARNCAGYYITFNGDVPTRST